MAVDDTGFDLAFEGQMFRTLLEIENTKKKESSPF